MTTPEPIRRFIEATNRGDTEAFLDAFTSDASLSDWDRSFRGREQIADWNQSRETAVSHGGPGRPR
ncbi:nuclear transport factor 2 family protein [Mesorhizobium sangaii]|uniref:Ketosteroid isomerase-like protein n=1 Tax=Mesorhizobium sangaii TaxID=505389 RepID=A0A841PDJ4_9HYPH|nr:nuclear transport factor 2 family protein [Mesorhizobium sangaii]MBB6411821.1 ketosteroid isomerase-like protein [Mesorhizobium sangaii]